MFNGDKKNGNNQVLYGTEFTGHVRKAMIYGVLALTLLVVTFAVPELTVRIIAGIGTAALIIVTLIKVNTIDRWPCLHDDKGKYLESK